MVNGGENGGNTVLSGDIVGEGGVENMGKMY